MDDVAITAEVDEPTTDPIGAQDGFLHTFPGDGTGHRRDIECECGPNLIIAGGRIVQVMHQNLDDE